MKPSEGLIRNIFGDHFKKLLSTFSWALQLTYGIVTLIAFIAFFINVTKLARSSGNPQGREQAMRGIIISGCCIALLGSIGLVYILVLSFAS